MAVVEDPNLAGWERRNNATLNAMQDASILSGLVDEFCTQHEGVLPPSLIDDLRFQKWRLARYAEGCQL